jgi:hypothetical protein
LLISRAQAQLLLMFEALPVMQNYRQWKAKGHVVIWAEPAVL